MRRLVSCLIAIVVLGYPLGTVGSVLARGHGYVSPKRFVLTRRDVPASFHQVGASSLTNAEADRADNLPRGTFERHGRVSSYGTSFRYSGRQLASVQDNVIAFKSSAGARWEYSRSVAQGRKPVNGVPFQTLTVRHLGDEASGFLFRQMIVGTPVTCGVVIFRRGAYTAWVVTCGFGPTYLASASPALARIVDKRMRAAF